MLEQHFFNQDAQKLAKALLGKVMFVKHEALWLQVMIIETEAYYCAEKASHASLGWTEKRKALFMPPGTLYMYYARGGDSLNISCEGEGNAVLIKAGKPYLEGSQAVEALQVMQTLNPRKNSNAMRPAEKLCAGQTLLCKSLGLKVPDWDQQNFNKTHFYIADVNHTPQKIIQTIRLGIPDGRDGHLPYRFVDYDNAASCTQNPLRKRTWQCGREYTVITQT